MTMKQNDPKVRVAPAIYAQLQRIRQVEGVFIQHQVETALQEWLDRRKEANEITSAAEETGA